MNRGRILVVDDEPGVRFGIRDYLEHGGFEVVEASDGESAVALLSAGRADVAVLDYQLADCNALELMRRLKAVDEGLPIVVLTGFGSIELAVRAIKEGAEQFLTKPVELPALEKLLLRLLDAERSRRRVAGHRRATRDGVDPFLGESPAIRRLEEQARRVLASDSPILIRGETGTGKSVLARWLHANGPRSEEAFVDLNCAGLSREFLESELFGHGKGAFTGAVAAKSGLLEIAHRGTVFLDEIGDVDPAVQPKLLVVLEEKRFRRLGEVGDRRVDIRLVAATHRDLASMVAANQFRSDLYYRVNTIPLLVPPLRERRDDLPLLAEGFLGALARDLGRPGARLHPSATERLLSYSWPGNIRELRNVLERAILLGSSEVIGAADLHFESVAGAPQAADEGDLTLAEVEERHIARVLDRTGGNVPRAATILGVPRSTLYKRLKEPRKLP